MNNESKYNLAFTESFGESENLIGLEYESIPEWDSVGHMTLISELEDVFDISMELDDIVEFSSYIEGKKILEKYGVVI